MASYEAQINLLVAGTRELDRLSDRLSSIERQIIDINRLGVRPQQRDPVTGRFGPDPDRQNRSILAGLQAIARTEEAIAGARRRSIQEQNAALEASINYQSKLNAANDLYQRKLEELSRGGGGRKLTQDLRDQVEQIQAAYEVATSGGTRNLNIVRSLATELGRVVERQNEINRLSSFRSKSFYTAQRFERQINDLSQRDATPSQIATVSRQVSEFRSAVSSGSQADAEDIKRRITESISRITRELDRAAEEAAEAIRATNDAARSRQSAVRSWREFFDAAGDEADRLRNENLARLARLRGATISEFPIGPLPAGRPGGARTLTEERQIIDQMFRVEKEIASIRDDSLKESVRLEEERLRLAEARKRKEREIRDAILDAVTAGKGEQVKGAIEKVKSGTQNALIRGGLAGGALALGKGAVAASAAGAAVSAAGSELATTLTSNTGPLSTVKNAVGESLVDAFNGAIAPIGHVGDALNNALMGVPDIVYQILQGVGHIPTALGAATIAAMAFGPALKTAAEATYEVGKAAGQTKAGKAVKETLNAQTNIFESPINALSEMNMEIDNTARYQAKVFEEATKSRLDNLIKNSMATLESSIQAAQRKVDAIERGQKRMQDKRAEDFESRLQRVRDRDAQRQEKNAFRENLALGAGFPLLFGAGPGSVAGSVIGSFFGSGFGGQILGSAIGQIFDQAIAGVKDLGNGIKLAGGEYSKLREQGLFFTAELEKQARLARQSGKQDTAVVEGALFAQTGDVLGLATKGATGAVNELQKAWDGVAKAVGTTLAILGAPFIFLLNTVLRLVQLIFVGINAVITGLAAIATLIPGVAALGEALNEQAIRGTVEYENQLNELNKQIEAQKILSIEAGKRLNATYRALGLSSAEFNILEKRADEAERQARFEQEIREIREKAPPGTEEGRKKQLEFIAEKTREFYYKEVNMALKNAQEIYTRVVENNRKVAEQKIQYEQQYQDMVLQNSRAQADFDISVARKAQDARIRLQEQELEAIKKITQAKIDAQKLANEEASQKRSLQAEISSDPIAGTLANTVQTAIDQWRAGRLSVEQEAEIKLKEIQLQEFKAAVAIERYKQDNALRIARANEDSALKIRRINEQINRQNVEASRARLDLFVQEAKFSIEKNKVNLESARDQYKENLRLIIAGKQAATPDGRKNIENEISILNAGIRSYEIAQQKIEKLFDGLTIARLTEMGPAPKLTDTSARAANAEQNALEVSAQLEKQISMLNKINNLRREDVELAKQVLDPTKGYLQEFNKIILAQQEQKRVQQIYLQLLHEGFAPEIARELAAVRDLTQQRLKQLSIIRQTIQANLEAERGRLAREQNPQKIQELQDRILALEKIIEEIRGAEKSIPDKSGQAQSAIKEKGSFSTRIAEEAARVREELENLLDPINMITSAAEGIGEAFSESFKGAISGSMTAQEALANLFKSTADMFMDMASKIIAKWIEMTILNTIVSLFPGGPIKQAAGDVASGASGAANAVAGAAKAVGAKKAANGSAISLPAIPFAIGGEFTNSIVSSPTLFKFADGASMETGLMGEAGPEAIMPLTRGPGGRLGVDASGAGGGDVVVHVAVDASGSKVQGDDAQASQLGRVIGAAVQQELIKQKRPGGLLA